MGIHIQLGEAAKIFRLVPLLAIAANTFASNVNSLLSAALINRMNISLYTPISSALAIIAGVIASFIYREEKGLFFYLSAIFAIIAVIV